MTTKLSDQIAVLSRKKAAEEVSVAALRHVMAGNQDLQARQWQAEAAAPGVSADLYAQGRRRAEGVTKRAILSDV